MSGFSSRVIDGIVWMGSAATGQIIVQIAGMAVLARILTPEQFGIASGVLIVVRTMQIFATIGIGAAIVQKPELEERDVSSGFWLSSVIGLFLGVSLFFFADAASELIKMPETLPLIRASSLIIPFVAFGVVAEALLQRQLRFKLISVIGLFSYIFGYAAVTIILAFLGFGVWAIIAGSIFTVIVRTTLAFVFAKPAIAAAISWPSTKQLVRFGFGQSFAKFFNGMAQQADNFVVARWLGAEFLGVYNRAYAMLMGPTALFGSALEQVLFPSLSSVQDESARLTNALVRSSTALAIVSLPLSVFLMAYAREIVYFLLGQQWDAVTGVFQILVFALYFRTCYKVNASVARSRGLIYRYAALQFIYVVLVFFGAWFGYHWGLNGVAVGVAGAVVLNYLTTLSLAAYSLRISPLPILRNVIRYYTIAAVFAAPSFLLAAAFRSQDLGFVWILFLGSVVQFAILALFYKLRSFLLEEEGLRVVDLLASKVQGLLVRNRGKS